MFVILSVAASVIMATAVGNVVGFSELAQRGSNMTVTHDSFYLQKRDSVLYLTLHHIVLKPNITISVFLTVSV